MVLSALLEKLENAAALDPVVNGVRGVVTKVIAPQPVRDALHGVWLGHPFHPSLVVAPIGLWAGATVLDAVPGTGPAASALIGAGIVSAVPTAAAGLTDWSDLHPQQMRVGLVHATSNVVALALYAGSLAARTRGRFGPGKLLALAGFTAVGVGGYLGGHLSYRQAAGANHTEDVPHLFPTGWQRVGSLDELPDRQLTARNVAGIELLVHRHGAQVDVLANKCSHLSGPLADGQYLNVDGSNCVQCPWHGSTFRLADGSVVHGPATSPQPVFSTRTVDGVLEVMLPGAG